MKAYIQQLKDITESLHKCVATYLEEVPVIEKFGDKIAWQGFVHIFRIEGNPKSDTCYAWSSPIEGSTKRRYYAALKVPPIDSPGGAVRASIVQDYRNSNEETENNGSK
jgi:hypothetical protein